MSNNSVVLGFASVWTRMLKGLGCLQCHLFLKLRVLTASVTVSCLCLSCVLYMVVQYIFR